MCFFLAFRLSRPLRAVQRPHYISFYQPKEDTPEIIVSAQEVEQWLKKKDTNSFTHNSTSLNSYQTNSSRVQTDFLLSKRIASPIPSLSVPIKDQYPFMYMSPRR